MTFSMVKMWFENGQVSVQEIPQAEVYVREWVDLTPEEIDDLVAYPWGETKDWVAAVAAKLKEKNT